MKLALESPTQLLKTVQPLSDFNFISARRVLNDTKYADFYTNKGTDVIAPYSIVNPNDGHGEPVSIEELKEVLKSLNLDGERAMVIAPDFPNNALATLGAYQECVEQFGENVVVGVLQGESFHQSFNCLAFYKTNIAVPIGLNTYPDEPPYIWSLKRHRLISMIPDDRFIHLLGFGSIEEFWCYEARPNVASLNTAMPILMGLREGSILDPLQATEKQKATLTQCNEILKQQPQLKQEQLTSIYANIALLRRYLP